MIEHDHLSGGNFDIRARCEMKYHEYTKQTFQLIKNKGFSMSARIIIFFILLLPFHFVSANETASIKHKKAPIVDRFIINVGVNKLFFKEEKGANGGVKEIKPVDDITAIGGGVSGALIFNTPLKPYFSPYIDIASYINKDRYSIIPGIGIRHDFNFKNVSWFQPFVATGVGYNRSKWTKIPINISKDLITAKDNVGSSAVWTVQAGSDFYMTNDLAINLTARYDMYDISTDITNTTMGTTTKLKDTGSLGVLLGFTYHFGNTVRNDLCPNTLPNVPLGATGCPLNYFKLTLNYVFAKYGMTDLTNEALFDIPAFLKKHPNYDIKLTAYADSIGSNQFNLKLSQKREKAVVEYLLGNGIAKSRIEANGRGSTEPLVDNDTEVHRDINRRILVEFYRTDKDLTIGTKKKAK